MLKVTAALIIGIVIGWRAPVFRETYRNVRPRCTRSRALAIATIAALGIGIPVQ